LYTERPEDHVSVLRSQIAGWLSELEVLRRNPTVMKFTQLQQKIDDADALIDQNATPMLPNELLPFEPYDAYDAFEFAHDLTGREISTHEISKLAKGRFPEMSDESRGLMLSYLIDHEMAEVARTRASGTPAAYRFGSFRSRGTSRTRKRLGIPGNELSALKVDDLEDVHARTSRVWP
jgi:hypothetical protein